MTEAGDGQQVVVVMDREAYSSWGSVGITQGLTTDSDIAHFLLTFYVQQKQRSGWVRDNCAACHSPLSLYCTTCQCPSPLSLPPIHPHPPSMTTHTPTHPTPSSMTTHTPTHHPSPSMSSPPPTHALDPPASDHPVSVTTDHHKPASFQRPAAMGDVKDEYNSDDTLPPAHGDVVDDVDESDDGDGFSRHDTVKISESVISACDTVKISESVINACDTVKTSGSVISACDTVKNSESVISNVGNESRTEPSYLGSSLKTSTKEKRRTSPRLVEKSDNTSTVKHRTCKKTASNVLSGKAKKRNICDEKQTTAESDENASDDLSSNKKARTNCTEQTVTNSEDDVDAEQTVTNSEDENGCDPRGSKTANVNGEAALSKDLVEDCETRKNNSEEKSGTEKNTDKGKRQDEMKKEDRRKGKSGKMKKDGKKQQDGKTRKACASQDLEEGFVLSAEDRSSALIHMYDSNFSDNHAIEDTPPKRPGRPRKRIAGPDSLNLVTGREKSERLCVDSQEVGKNENGCVELEKQGTGKCSSLCADSMCSDEEMPNSQTQMMPNSQIQKIDCHKASAAEKDRVEEVGPPPRPLRVLVSSQKILALKTISGNYAHNFYSYFECSHCKKAFVHKRAFNKHIQKHTGAKEFKCTVCGKGFRRSCDRLKHERRHKLECSHCGKRFSDVSQLDSHLKLHTQNGGVMRCSGCKFETRDFHQYEKHGSKCSVVVQCDVCGVRLKSRFALRFHIAAVHDNHRPFKCDVCDKSFVLKTNLTSHVKSRHREGGRAFHCDQCSYSAFDARALTIHQRCVHSSERPFQCPHCPSAFARRFYLVVHLRRHTGEKPHRCPECSQAFAQRASLTRHCRRAHPLPGS